MEIPVRDSHAGVTAILLWCIAGLGCGVEYAAPGVPPYLTVFLVDGLSQSVFEEELAAGRLPNVARLIREGTYIEHGIGAFPSMTGYGFYPFLTGVDAVRSGVLGYRWFDRDAAAGNLRNYAGRTRGLMNRDLVADLPTLFEEFPDQHSSSFNALLDRGAHRHEEARWAFAASKFRATSRGLRLLGLVPVIGARVAPTLPEMEGRLFADVLDDLARRPKVQWVVFASPDVLSHMGGMDAGYVELVRHIDHLIGRYRARAAALGLDGQRVYAFVSDHGVVDVGRHVDLRAALAPLGVHLKRDPSSALWDADLDTPRAAYAEWDGVIAVNGNTMNYMYLRDPSSGTGEGLGGAPAPAALRAYRPRAGGPSVDVIDVLRKIPGVELVAARTDSTTVAVFDRTGFGEIRLTDGRYAYRAVGHDPLGYCAHPATRPLADGTPRTADTWLAATAETTYPYAVVRLYDVVTHPKAGDIVLTAEAGYDLAPDFELVIGGYRGGHGGIRADQIRVPYVLAGPGVVSGGRLAVARAEDIGATLRHLLGLPVPAGAGGVVLRRAVTHPRE